MNTHEKGLEFENKAIEILKKEGYSIKCHISNLVWTSPYDIMVQKNNQLVKIEVRGSKKYQFCVPREKIKKLKKGEHKALILCIKEQDYAFIDVKDIKEDFKPIKSGKFNVCFSRPFGEEKERPHHPLDKVVKINGIIKKFRICRIVKPSGTGGAIIVPKELIGKKIYIELVEDETSKLN